MRARDAVGTGAPQVAADTCLSRREFLAAAGGLGAACALLSSPWLAAMGAHASEAARRGAAFVNLTAPQGRALAAVVDRIIPAVDGLPGAAEAGAAHFADLALGGPFAPARAIVDAGLADLDNRARALHPGSAGYGDLALVEQDSLLHEVDNTPFFRIVSTLAIFGTLAPSQYGGNRKGAGWRLVQVEPGMRWQPPFGWYDAQWAHEHPGALT